MEKDKLLEYVKECYDESKSGFQSLLSEVYTDNSYYVGDQWLDSDLEEAKRRKLPTLSLNLVKKQVDTVSGLERQNKADIKVFPIESGDDIVSEVLTQTVKWVTSSRSMVNAKSEAYKESLIGGLSWLSVEMDYSRDFIEGDIVVAKDSVFNLLPDPQMTKMDLSDCSYLVRHKKMPKRKLKNLYPKFKKEIDSLSAGDFNDGVRHETNVSDDKKKNLTVVELWYKETVEKTFVINTNDVSDSSEWKGDEDRLVMMIQANPHYTPIKRNMEVLKLAIVIENKTIVFDGINPMGLDMFPFIPIPAYYTQASDDWGKKLQGLVRPLRDIQNEKNKRRTSILQATGTMAHSGWIIDKGAVDDVSKLRNAGGRAVIIEKNIGRGMTPIAPPNLPNGLVQLEQLFDNDARQIGLSPDMIGQLHSSNDSGKSIQLRQKQGLSALMEVSDNLSYATRHLGNIIVSIILKKFSNEKIQRILGDKIQVPENFDQSRESVRYDIHIDEIANSPTHKMQMFEQLMQAQQYGIQVPIESLVNYMEMPVTEKQKMLEQIEQQKQQAQMMQQQQMEQQNQQAIQQQMVKQGGMNG